MSEDNMHRTSTLARCAILTIVAALFVACGSDTVPPTAAPGIQPEIINAVDNFQFQVTAVENYSGTLNYNWTNTGLEANVNQACAVTTER
jgi:hypothetical protein